MTPENAQSFGKSHIRSIIRQVLPGVVLPGLIYLVLRPHTGLLIALAAASSVPLLDLVTRLLRGKSPSPTGMVFVACTAISVGLAAVLRSPMFILAKGAMVSGVMGSAFAISALIRRPLTRTVALHLSADHTEARRHLAERWGQPKAMDVFRTLSLGWGILLLLTSGQQFTMAMTVSPGTMMALDPPVHAFLTAVGVVASILYVRRVQRSHPEIGLLPTRATAPVAA